jgi:hypothetical protein
MLGVGGLGTAERAARSAVDAKAVPDRHAVFGRRVVTSWTSQVLPSGSVK